jgi:glycosyltransferase involved in cell wall biosynthesis
MAVSFTGWITACIPHYRCQRYIRRAVESLLSQSYPWIRIIVLNDGDPCPPWRELASITDPRLVRFELPENAGPFFCSEVARLATPDPFFLIQDADDWSAPRRAELLLAGLLGDNSEFVVSSQPQFCESADGTPYPVSIRWDWAARGPTDEQYVLQSSLTEEFCYRAPHHGLFQAATLRDIGGYYGGLRCKWDTLIPNLVLMIGSIGWTPSPLYYRLLRGNSLTHSVQTGPQSKAAVAEYRCMQQLYKECHNEYQRLKQGEIDRDQLCASIRQICGRNVTTKSRATLERQAQRLRREMA